MTITAALVVFASALGCTTTASPPAQGAHDTAPHDAEPAASDPKSEASDPAAPDPEPEPTGPDARFACTAGSSRA